MVEAPTQEQIAQEAVRPIMDTEAAARKNARIESANKRLLQQSDEKPTPELKLMAIANPELRRGPDWDKVHGRAKDWVNSKTKDIKYDAQWKIWLAEGAEITGAEAKLHKDEVQESRDTLRTRKEADKNLKEIRKNYKNEIKIEEARLLNEAARAKMLKDHQPLTPDDIKQVKAEAEITVLAAKEFEDNQWYEISKIVAKEPIVQERLADMVAANTFDYDTPTPLEIQRWERALVQKYTDKAMNALRDERKAPLIPDEEVRQHGDFMRNFNAALTALGGDMQHPDGELFQQAREQALRETRATMNNERKTAAKTEASKPLTPEQQQLRARTDWLSEATRLVAHETGAMTTQRLEQIYEQADRLVQTHDAEKAAAKAKKQLEKAAQEQNNAVIRADVARVNIALLVAEEQVTAAKTDEEKKAAEKQRDEAKKAVKNTMDKYRKNVTEAAAALKGNENNDQLARKYRDALNEQKIVDDENTKSSALTSPVNAVAENQKYRDKIDEASKKYERVKAKMNSADLKVQLLKNTKRENQQITADIAGLPANAQAELVRAFSQPEGARAAAVELFANRLSTPEGASIFGGPGTLDTVQSILDSLKAFLAGLQAMGSRVQR